MEKEMILVAVCLVISGVLVASAYVNSNEGNLSVDQFQDGQFTDGQLVNVYGMVTDVHIENGVGYLVLDNDEYFKYAYGDFPGLPDYVYHNVILTVEYHPYSVIVAYEVVN